MKFVPVIGMGMLMLSLLYAQIPDRNATLLDKATEFTGRWKASLLPNTVIGTGPFRQLFIQKFSEHFDLTIIRGTRGTVGVNERAEHIFQTTTTEIGPYILSRDGDRFVYRDEKLQTNYLAIVTDKGRTYLNDGTNDYFWEGPKQP